MGFELRSIGGEVLDREAAMPRRFSCQEFLEADLQNEDYVDLLDDDSLDGMARRYGVSVQALVNRLKNLGYIPE
jgi:hypothetical protein